jgi:TRAP transporter TAXI family solute receptor
MRRVAARLCAFLLLAPPPAMAADASAPIIVHAGKADSLTHTLAVQFAEAVASGNNALTIQVEESQGSVQNIIDAAKNRQRYIFTATPSLIAQARRGDKPFEHNIHYREIRALFPIPPLTVHWVVRADSGIKRFADLAGRPFAPGAKGSFAERQTASALHVLGLDRRVQLIDIDAAGAKAAFAGKQVIGMALAGTYPMPAVAGLASTTPIRLLSLAPDEIEAVLAADDSTAVQVIPKGTYPGIDEDVTTIAQPAGAYTTTQMSERLAYAITKAFWSQKWVLGQRNPPWATVTPASLAALGVKLHAGALRYYREAGVKVPASLR